MIVCICSFKYRLSRIFRVLEPSSHQMGSMNTLEGINFVVSQVGLGIYPYKQLGIVPGLRRISQQSWVLLVIIFFHDTPNVFNM